VGVSDKETEGKWMWVDGSEATNDELKWKENEPNSSGNENCGHMLSYRYGKMNDRICSNSLHGLCEKEFEF